MTGNVDETIEGGCMCGSVRYRLSRKPIAVMVCHCSRCRHQSGSAFSVNLMVKADTMAIEGALSMFVSTDTDSGVPIDIEFCPRCGSPVRSRPGTNRQLFALKAGTADDPSQFKPTVHVWTESALPWVEIPSDVLRFPRAAVR